MNGPPVKLSFLCEKGFRHPKNNKAKYFEATITWEGGMTQRKGLEEAVDERQPELIKYIPQNFLETICTQFGNIEESDFDRELKEVIFSHVSPADRLGKQSLDDLIAYKTTEALARIRILKEELWPANQEVALLENRGSPGHRTELENRLALKRDELSAHEGSIPEEVPQPENDPEKQKEMADLAQSLEGARTQVAECDRQISEASEKQSQLALKIAAADRLLSRLDNLKRQLDAFVLESQADLKSLAIDEEDIFKVSINKEIVSNARTNLLEAKRRVGLLNDSGPSPESSQPPLVRATPRHPSESSRTSRFAMLCSALRLSHRCPSGDWLTPEEMPWTESNLTVRRRSSILTAPSHRHWISRECRPSVAQRPIGCWRGSNPSARHKPLRRRAPTPIASCESRSR
jgi:hypothetical protein